MRTNKTDQTNGSKQMLRGAHWIAAALGIAGTAYGIYCGVTWLRYGHFKAGSKSRDSWLDELLPEYEVTDCHSVHVCAPSNVAFAAASNMDLLGSIIVRSIFKLRELILGGRPDERHFPPSLLDQAKSLGWGELARVSDREVVMGAVTRPWEPNVVFQAMPPKEFAAFDAPGYVKIAWTLRADPVSATESIVRTETRALTTDGSARSKFRVYWSAFSPGIILIRRALLRRAKNEAERLVSTCSGTQSVEVGAAVNSGLSNSKSVTAVTEPRRYAS